MLFSGKRAAKPRFVVFVLTVTQSSRIASEHLDAACATSVSKRIAAIRSNTPHPQAKGFLFKIVVFIGVGVAQFNGVKTSK